VFPIRRDGDPSAASPRRERGHHGIGGRTGARDERSGGPIFRGAP
jgi:hypothetical protein